MGQKGQKATKHTPQRSKANTSSRPSTHRDRPTHHSLDCRGPWT